MAMQINTLLSLFMETKDIILELRTKKGLSQDELSNIVGISRQTYSAIETNKRKMSWNTFLSLLLVFGYNEKTATMLEMSGAFPVELKNILNVDRRKEDK